MTNRRILDGGRIAWQICVRDRGASEDRWLGPYRSPEGAERVARRLRRDVAARQATEAMDVFVEEIRSGADLEGFREEMLQLLDQLGYGDSQ